MSLRCPRCRSASVNVIESRAVMKGATVRRKRRCWDCDHIWRTYEVSEAEYDHIADLKALLGEIDHIIGAFRDGGESPTLITSSHDLDADRDRDPQGDRR